MKTKTLPKIKLTELNAESVFLLKGSTLLTVNRKVRAVILPVNGEDQAMQMLDDYGLPPFVRHNDQSHH